MADEDLLFDKVPYSFLKRHKMSLSKREDGEIVVHAVDKHNFSAIDQLQMLLGVKVEVVEADEETILTELQREYRIEGASEYLSQLKSPEAFVEVSSIEDELLEGESSVPVIKFLNLILKEAIDQRVSDIHFEPTEKDLKIRYRIDGMLYEKHNMPLDFKSALITRIKVLAKMDIAERRLPQDGRVRIHVGGREVDMRVSTVPVVNGERVVLRILDKQNIILDIDALGMPEGLLESFKEVVSYPEGIILVTGPTGSGKTTTLYSVLKHLTGRYTNIMTIEDPPEYKLPGISQIAVRPKIGLTFSRGLRHLLRQDPDVLMVGEIRDVETAEIAIQAALTGHLVVSTLHTNDAISAIPRLIDMGVEPYLLSATVIGVVAQRLVRKVCSYCCEKREVDEGYSAFIREYMPGENRISCSYGKGCELCYGVGYKKRLGVYEFLRPDAMFRSEIAAKRPYHILKDKALEIGFKPLVHHGIDLICSGKTTPEEVLRVTKKYG